MSRLEPEKKDVFIIHFIRHKTNTDIFNFLFYPDVPYDNNISERTIRNLKVKQKVSGGFRSDRGAEIFEAMRSVVDKIIKNGGNPSESIRSAINVATCKKIFFFH